MSIFRRNIGLWEIVLALLGCLAAPSILQAADPAPSPTPPVDLISNGNFQTDGKHANWPDGWGSLDPTQGKTWQTGLDSSFMRLVSQQPGQLQVLYRELKFKPGEVPAVNLSINYRTSQVKPGPHPGDDARAVILFHDQAGNLLNPQPDPLIFAPASDWTDTSAHLIVPPTAVRMILIAGLVHTASGTIDIARISCTPLDQAAAQKLIASAPKPPAPPKSWIVNGDFQQPDASGQWPAAWDKPQPGMSWPGENGRHFVRLISQKPGETLMLNRLVPIRPGTSGLVVFIRSRTTGVEHGDHEWFDARTIIHFLGADGKPVANEGRGLDLVFTHKPEPTDWSDHAHFLTVPPGAVQLQLRSGLFLAKAGTIDFADIEVWPLNDADTALLKLAGDAYASWKSDENAAAERKVETQIKAQVAATGNLVPNGLFTLAVKNPAWPDNWGNGPTPGITWENENGKRFMRLTSSDPQKTVMLYKMVVLPAGLKAVEVSYLYRLTHFVKGDKPPGDARVIIHFLDGTRFGHLENGKDLPSPLTTLFFTPTATWTEVKARALVPAGATKIQLIPALWNVQSGTLDFAEIHVTPSS